MSEQKYHVGSGRTSGAITVGCDNVIAWRLGEASRKAADCYSGDLIDRGLALIVALKEKGFEVIFTAQESQSTEDEGKR